MSAAAARSTAAVTPSWPIAALHLAAHALGKITLFFAAGSIHTAAHLTEVSQLDGIGRRMPWTMGAFAVGALAMIGVPPTAGFLGKWFILMGAMQTANWMRAIAEQNLNQSKAAFEGLLTIARSAVSGVDQQAAFMRDSMLFAEETLENTFDFAQKLVRMKEPQEFPQIQTEFVSRQAQVLAGSGQRIIQDVNDVAKTTLEGAAESSRRRSEAA